MKTKLGNHDLTVPEPKDEPVTRSPETAPDNSASRHVRRILVPIDFSDCSVKALDYASGLAAQLGSKITVLHIVEPALHADNYLAASSVIDPTTDNLLESARDRLGLVAAKHIAHRLESEALVRMGRAPSEILDTAKALGADMIIMGTHGHTGLKHVLLGSTAERVLRQAGCPVLTIRSS